MEKGRRRSHLSSLKQLAWLLPCSAALELIEDDEEFKFCCAVLGTPLNTHTHTQSKYQVHGRICCPVVLLFFLALLATQQRPHPPHLACWRSKPCLSTAKKRAETDGHDLGLPPLALTDQDSRPCHDTILPKHRCQRETTGTWERRQQQEGEEARKSVGLLRFRVVGAPHDGGQPRTTRPRGSRAGLGAAVDVRV
jgi:hypothetical protein